MSLESSRHGLAAAALLLLLAISAGCGDSGGSPTATNNPPPPDPPPFEVASGTFEVACEKLFDSCASTTDHAGTYSIEIDSLSFAMGDEWTGTWDPGLVKGYGESERHRDAHRDCYVTRWTSVTVTFESEDAFNGTVTFRQRVSGECMEPCLTTWRISGSRVE